MKKIIVVVMALVSLTITAGCERRNVEVEETTNTPVVETTVEEPERKVRWVLDGEEIDPESYIAQQIIAANADRCYYEQYGKHMQP